MKVGYSVHSVCCGCAAMFAVRPCNAPRSVRCRACRKVYDNERRKVWRRTHPPAVPRRREKDTIVAYASRRRELARDMGGEERAARLERETAAAGGDVFVADDLVDERAAQEEDDRIGEGGLSRLNPGNSGGTHVCQSVNLPG